MTMRNLRQDGVAKFDSVKTVREYLWQNKWKYTFEQMTNAMRFKGVFGGLKNVTDPVKFVLLVRKEDLFSSAIYPFIVPKKKRLEICELMNRANEHMIYGHFEMNMQTGKVRFRITQNWKDMKKTGVSKHMQRLMYLPVTMIDRYAKAFMAVIRSEACSEMAYAEAVKVLKNE